MKILTKNQFQTIKQYLSLSFAEKEKDQKDSVF